MQAGVGVRVEGRCLGPRWESRGQKTGTPRCGSHEPWSKVGRMLDWARDNPPSESAIRICHPNPRAKPASRTSGCAQDRSPLQLPAKFKRLGCMRRNRRRSLVARKHGLRFRPGNRRPFSDSFGRGIPAPWSAASRFRRTIGCPTSFSSGTHPYEDGRLPKNAGNRKFHSGSIL